MFLMSALMMRRSSFSCFFTSAALVKSASLPDRNPNNPKYELAVNTWKRLPLPVANFLGPFVSPYLA